MHIFRNPHCVAATSSPNSSIPIPTLHFRIRIDKNGGAWCPKNMIGKEGKEWIEIDLGSTHAIQATESQGRFGNGQGAEFTEAYMLEYYRPRLNKWVRYRTREGKEVLDANSNTYVEVKNELNPVILASKVRFHPHSNYKRTICMRVEVYGCQWDDGIMSYSMPQGDKRGTAYEFYDWTYDGEWRGSELVNGLGCLTDGDYGPENFKLSYYAQSKF
jgi:discoidin domain receptor family protein 2